MILAALLIGIVTNTTRPEPSPRVVLMPVEECEREAARCSRNLAALLELQDAATASIADLKLQLEARDAVLTPPPPSPPCPEGWTGAEVFRIVVIVAGVAAVVAGGVGLYVGANLP